MLSISVLFSAYAYYPLFLPPMTYVLGTSNLYPSLFNVFSSLLSSTRGRFFNISDSFLSVTGRPGGLLIVVTVECYY